MKLMRECASSRTYATGAKKSAMPTPATIAWPISSEYGVVGVVTDAIQGVTLNLSKASPDATTTLTVAADSSGIAKSVAGFVQAYNDLAPSIGSLTKYDVANKKAAILTGDSAPRIAQSQLRSIMGAALTGGGLSLTSLSQVGVSFKADGTLNLDTARLNAAITTDASAVARVFAAVGSATDSPVSVTATRPW